MIDANAVEHLNLKIFVADGSRVDLNDAIRTFHRWIRERLRPETLIDVADYRHVPAGPGILLIGHEANYSIDNREERTGLLYNRKAPLAGTFQDRLRQAYQSTLEACELFASEPCFLGELRFDTGAIEVSVNDRLLAPNREDTWNALRPEIERFFPNYQMERRGEPRDLFRIALAKVEIRGNVSAIP